MNPMLVKIADNTLHPKTAFAAIRDLIDKIANKTLKQLEDEGIFVYPDLVREAKVLDKDQILLKSINDEYRTSNIMGFLGYGKKSLVIQSRFSGQSEGHVQSEDYFFQYILHRVLDFPDVITFKTDSNQENTLFNFWLFLFPQYLRAAMRKGVFKQYIRNKYNDSNIKGIIDIARHIKENTPFMGKIAYSLREFSFDNALMELIRHTIEYIKGKPLGRTLLAKVQDEVSLVISATPKYRGQDREKIIALNQKHPVRHAYFHEYRALQRLCILILRHQKHQIGTGTHQIYGILFDGAWLWEEYVNKLIGDIFNHPKNKGERDGAQRLFHNQKDEKKGLIYPDFISKNAQKRTIADAKYKPIGNIGNADYFQVLAYMFRFEAKKGYYLYPESSETPSETLWLNQGTTFEKNVRRNPDISVVKLGLKIPKDATSYEDFSRKISYNEQKFRDTLRKEATDA